MISDKNGRRNPPLNNIYVSDQFPKWPPFPPTPSDLVYIDLMNRTEMTIKTTELLKLLSKAKQLGFSVEVREDKDGDYVVCIYEMFRPEGFDEKVVITQKGEMTWNKGYYCFDAMMDILDEQLEEKRQEEIKEQKRQELLARLTDFEKDLLGVK